MVGKLLDIGDPDRLLGPEPYSDAEFADHLVDCELALIAFGEEPLRIALHLAVLSIARDSVRTYAAIHALPEPRHRVALRGRGITLVARCSGGRGSGTDTPGRRWDS
jgi:hypothetical protein